MNTFDRSDAGQEPLAIDGLLTPDERRLTVNLHHEFQKSISSPRPFDAVDLECDDMTIVDPYEIHAPSRKSDVELNRVLSILDNLENGKKITR